MKPLAFSVADVMLSALISFISDRLSASEFLNFARKEQFLFQLNMWENLLPKINALLHDALQSHNASHGLELWLSDLRDLAYDAEDIIDEIDTEVQRRRILGHTQFGTTSKVRFLFPPCCAGFNSSGIKFSGRLGAEMKAITARFQQILKQKNVLKSGERGGQGKLDTKRERLRSTSSLDDESQVFGRDKDKQVILEQLMDGESGVISIVGMGGVGKTTLAQLVYNDDKIENFFELRVWACVSMEFDVIRVTRTLLQGVTLESLNSKDFNSLQVKLKEMLSGKKFLIVLDDVWNENYEEWEVLRTPFVAGAPGSKVLVTTRNERVASIMTTYPVYHLPVLSEDACFLLFVTHALGASNFDEHPNLKVIGEQIVCKCRGLPLAIKTLAGLLHGKVNYAEWEDLLRREMWDIPEERSGILPDLMLSYHYLPSHLKQCFAYCAVFPKDHEIDKNDLVLLWMAEGLIQQAKGKKQMQDIGLTYFHDLVSMSFFQQSNRNKTLFVMHDLINDLAQFVAGEICFHFEDTFEDKPHAFIPKLHHLSFTRHQDEISKRFEALDHMESLRTFIALPMDTSSRAARYYINNKVLQELLAKFRYLRVLCLSGYCMDEIPYSIGHLKHLRYLNLSYSTIKQLPESVGKLFNLQTLLLRGCKELTKLPQGIENLINLLVLELTDTEKLVEMPLRIGNLKNLQVLSRLSVGKDNRFGIRELKDLKHLKGELSITGLENVVNVQDARDANLMDKRGIDSLCLKWSESLDHQNEEGDPSFTNIGHMSLNNCSKSMSLPSLGRLPSLKKLFIQGMNGVKTVGLEFYGYGLPSAKRFPSLEILWFMNMLEWEHWSSTHRGDGDLADEFPSLHELMIQNCPKLTGDLPRCLPSLVKLTISCCPKLEGSLEAGGDGFKEEEEEENRGAFTFAQSYCFNSTGTKFSGRFRLEIEAITARFQEIVKPKNVLNWVESGGQEKLETKRDWLPSTSSLDNESPDLGRDKDKQLILSWLMDGETGVISIVGMGGVGKTTLAQLVYNDDKIENFFELRVWVCVSREFDITRVTRILVQAVTLESFNFTDLNSYEQWDVLRTPFMAGAPGSKVLVTTRNERVVSIMTTYPVYHLPVLSNKACFLLFVTHALGASNFDEHPNLKEIGKEIVCKCKGLPLAAKTLGGLLRGRVNGDEWEDLLRSEMWDIREERSGILPALMLSYHYLPSHLKRCFAYCAIFPKDYEFDKNDLVLLWMAEGLIQQAKGQDIDLTYFHDLVSMSFFQHSNSNKTLFVMHDLINDLAQSVAREICSHFGDTFEDKSHEFIAKLRHLSFTRHQYEISKRFEALDRMQSSRTFIAFPMDASSLAAGYSIGKNVLQELLEKLGCLRVLSLSGYWIDEIPYSIDHLKHLRYLNLSHSTIKQFPESVGNLFNLQTLLLRGCRELTKLPQGIENLIKLLVLDLTNSEKLVEMPLQIGKLIKLQVLSKFCVGKDNQFGIRELKDLKHLKGELSITGLENVVNVRDARDANLMDKHGIEGLYMKWSSEFLDHQNEEREMLVLDMLKPNTNLKELTISFYDGERFPSWLGDPSFTNIVHMNLNNCSKSMSLPSLGRLPLLKKLSIRGMNRVKKVGLEFYGDRLPYTKRFPFLEILWFQNMLEWEHWSSTHKGDEDLDDEFPSLRELMLQNCPKLTGDLPRHLPSLVRLIISRCPKLEGSLVSLPSLCELNIEDCNKEQLKNIVQLTSLTTLRIQSIRDLVCLPQEMLESLGALQTLDVSNCAKLTFFWQKSTGLKNIVSLKHLKIKGCSKFVSLIENEQGLYGSLDDIELINYGDFEKLTFKSLHFESCPKLVSFPETGCLSTLRHLMLKDCVALKNLPDWKMMLNYKTSYCLLEELEIEECPSLTCLPGGIMLTRLQRLKIQALISFPEAGLSPTLKTLEIYSCANLNSLPERMQNLASLQCLTVCDCPCLVSFPEGGLSPQLLVLEVWDCMNLKEPMSEWNLHSLASLKELIIVGAPDTASFPDEKCLLPTSLTSIVISRLNSLESLSTELQNLSSLEELEVSDCPKLRELPREGMPAKEAGGDGFKEEEENRKALYLCSKLL
ncbi:hypothetical protein SLEP1_g23769 [Rubroshorea leprosula]|uniref:Disease resistance RPP13-like protein 1 n=1 Tax=Rubroshorea leprosula TaxID=152421 RepID=A0AAV5JJN0_9ROSI|nr:hypothetical protein SLEP1_g23769 [Rubroshorea leprosula]